MATHKSQTNEAKTYPEFYLELSATDYMQDIEIQDAYEAPSEAASRGLSDEQVSQIAADSLESARQAPESEKQNHPRSSPHPAS